MRKSTLSLAIVAATLANAGAAYAHAHLRSAVPAVDGTVAAAPTDVAITFSEGVEPKFSSIEVQDASGKRVDTGEAHIAPSNDKILSVDLGTIPPGTYTVIWHATAVDTHKTDGKFNFTVKP